MLLSNSIFELTDHEGRCRDTQDFAFLAYQMFTVVDRPSQGLINSLGTSNAASQSF